MKPFLSSLTEEQKNLFLNLLSFSDGFSVDWFPEHSVSHRVGLVLKLHQQGWIVSGRETDFYRWSPEFPRQELIQSIAPEETLSLARRCIEAGVKEGDLPIIMEAAAVEEKNHKITSTVFLYESVIHFINDLVAGRKENLTDYMRRSFIRAVDYRAGVSLVFPNYRKINAWLVTAREMAGELGNKKTEASLELMIGQNYWMSLRARDAVEHLHRGWDMARELHDEEMERRSLRLKMLDYLSQGRLFEAIGQHDQVIGNIESFDVDFALLTIMALSFIYTETAMPQRGLGLCDAIRDQCSKQENNLLLSFSYLMSGAILLEIRQLKSSKTCFEKVADIARNEDIYSLEYMAKIGLICLACLEDRYDTADEIYETIKHTPRAAWHYLFNLYALFETFYRLYGKDVLPGMLDEVRDEKLQPMIINMIRRLRIILSDSIPVEEKISGLAQQEAFVGQSGSIFELAKIRTAMAYLYLQVGNRPQAEIYAREAWKFYRTVARDAFPGDLLHLLPPRELSKDSSLSDLVIEMGKALSTRDSLEVLLTNIIASLSRMTGAERCAIFTRDNKAPGLKMVASRNLFHENIVDEDFNLSFKNIQQVAISGKEKIFAFEIAFSEIMERRQAVITPLMLNEQAIGVLYQDSRFFSLDVSPEGINIISALASQIALAIDRAQAHDEIAKLNRKLIEENLYYLDEKEEFRPFNEIIGSSKGIMEVQQVIRKVAPAQSAVLISGETGVGKELVARAIHRESSRKNNAFIRVNCAALPESLIDSELFGHEKGAFTGAVKTKAGRFELAHQGTIFLDEVSELPPATQSRLLRVLQEKEFQRVGGTKLLYSDFRLITATNKDLQKEVESGRFRRIFFTA